jgi:succinate dehydrogenase / fumarate reductase flavoprotein subunit
MEAACWSAGLDTQVRDRAAIEEARDEVDQLLARRGPELARPLQRALRDLMSECCGVVRSEYGLREGLERIRALEERVLGLEVRPDIAGYADLTHAFDLQSSLLAARATLECARERRETRGAHNRSDFPAQEPSLRVTLTRTPGGGTEREPIGEPSAAVAALAGSPVAELEIAGRLLE